jgi:hypothetical protein
MSTKKEQLEIYDQVFKKNADYNVLIDRLVASKKDFFMRKTSHMVSIVSDGTEYIYKSKAQSDAVVRFPANQLWIFNAVQKDALRFLDEQNDFVLPQKLPVNVTNYEYVDSYGEITGTDINSA